MILKPRSLDKMIEGERRQKRLEVQGLSLGACEHLGAGGMMRPAKDCEEV